MPEERVDAHAGREPARDPRADVHEHYRYLKQRTVCEMCGAEAITAHCKIVCTACGYRLTCSDPM